MVSNSRGELLHSRAIMPYSGGSFFQGDTYKYWVMVVPFFNSFNYFSRYYSILSKTFSVSKLDEGDEGGFPGRGTVFTLLIIFLSFHVVCLPMWIILLAKLLPLMSFLKSILHFSVGQVFQKDQPF